MTTFKSPKVKVKRSAKYLFDKFSNLNNLKEILPDSINEFKSTESTCSFKIEGLPTLKFKLDKMIPFKNISLIAIDSQIPFTLECTINENDDVCNVLLEINAELNMMMKIMAEKPINQLLTTLSAKITEV